MKNLRIYPHSNALLLLLSAIFYIFALAKTGMPDSVNFSDIFQLLWSSLSKISYKLTEILQDIRFCVTYCTPADNVIMLMESHTTLVGLAAGAMGDVKLEAQRAGDRSRTQVYIALCWGQNNGMIIIYECGK